MSFSFLHEDSVYEERPIAAAPLREMDEEGQKEFFAHLALRHCPRIGPIGRKRLLQYYKSAYTAIENRKNWAEISIGKEIIQEFGKESWRQKAEKEWKEAARSAASVLLWSSPHYPARLREIHDPPSYLYCLGDISLLAGPMVGVVGSRKASGYGINMANIIAQGLAERGITVISGMALGIDRHAHLAAVEKVGKSVGVLGTGVNVCYPIQNKDIYDRMIEEGLLLSEFSPVLPPIGVNFPVRNRLISGLALGVVVVEAAERSGSLITAHYALEQNREVFAAPGKPLSPHSIGCQNLIRQGAHPVFCVDDIMRELSESLKAFKYDEPDITPCLEIPRLPEEDSAAPEETLDKLFAEKELVEKCCGGDLSDKIIRCLEKGSMHIEELAEALNENMNEINSKLVFLELLGKIRRLPGARFEAL